MKNETIQLDVIPIYKNEMYPTKKDIKKNKNDGNAPRELKLEYMFIEIEHKFSDCDCIIVTENGKVIKIIGSKDE